MLKGKFAKFILLASVAAWVELSIAENPEKLYL